LRAAPLRVALDGGEDLRAHRFEIIAGVEQPAGVRQHRAVVNLEVGIGLDADIGQISLRSCLRG
jgi:hypothetical protein